MMKNGVPATRGVLAQPERARREHARVLHRLQHPKLFAARQAFGDARRRIHAQHPAMRARVRAAADLDVERPVLLHGAAAHALERRDGRRVARRSHRG